MADHSDDSLEYAREAQQKSKFNVVNAGISLEKNIKLIEKVNLLRKRFDDKNYDYTLEVESLEILFEFAKLIQEEKAKTYKNSWIKRGWYGVFFNIARKFDRLENIFTNTKKLLQFEESQEPDLNEESVLDTMIDLLNYNGLASTRIMLTKPKIFDDWLKRNGIMK